MPIEFHGAPEGSQEIVEGIIAQIAEELSDRFGITSDEMLRFLLDIVWKNAYTPEKTLAHYVPPKKTIYISQDFLEDMLTLYSLNPADSHIRDEKISELKNILEHELMHHFQNMADLVPKTREEAQPFMEMPWQERPFELGAEIGLIQHLLALGYGDDVVLKRLRERFSQEDSEKILEVAKDADSQSLIAERKQNSIFKSAWFEKMQKEASGPLGERLKSVVKIFVVRHGQTIFNATGLLRGHLDPPLSDEGLKQAEETAKQFKDVKIDKIYSSDLIRSKQTAQAISDVVGVPVISTYNFRPINFGAWQSQPIEKIQEDMDNLFEQWKTDPLANAPEGSSYEEFQTRNLNQLLEILEDAEVGQNIVITCHLRNCILFLALFANGLKPLAGEDLELLNRFSQDTANISILAFSKDTGEMQIEKENSNSPILEESYKSNLKS